MKDAISGMGLYLIVILFIALFATYVSVTTTYSRCFRIKDEIVQVIEHYRGVNEDSVESVNNLLRGAGYNSQHDCPDGFSGFSRGSGLINGYGTKPNYCLKKTIVATNQTSADNQVVAGVGMYNQAYYQVVIFFKLEWPIFRNIFNVTIKGETRIITNPHDTISVNEENL